MTLPGQRDGDEPYLIIRTEMRTTLPGHKDGDEPYLVIRTASVAAFLPGKGQQIRPGRILK